MAQGWECPKCGAVYAPWAYRCDRCTTTVVNLPFTQTCSCNTSARCPIHAPPFVSMTTSIGFNAERYPVLAKIWDNAEDDAAFGGSS